MGIICSRCKTENKETNNYCVYCGESLERKGLQVSGEEEIIEHDEKKAGHDFHRGKGCWLSIIYLAFFLIGVWYLIYPITMQIHEGINGFISNSIVNNYWIALIGTIICDGGLIYVSFIIGAIQFNLITCTPDSKRKKGVFDFLSYIYGYVSIVSIIYFFVKSKGYISLFIDNLRGML